MPDYNPDAAKEAAERAKDNLSSDGGGSEPQGLDIGNDLVDLGKKAYNKSNKKSGEGPVEEGAEDAGKEGSKEAGKEGTKEAGKEGTEGGTKEGAKDLAKAGAKEAAEIPEELAKEAAKEGAKEAAEEAGKTGASAIAGIAPGMGTLTTAGMEGADAANKAAQATKDSGGPGSREQGSYAGDRADDAVQSGINIAESAVADVAGAAADVVGAGPVVEPAVRIGEKALEKATFGAGEKMGVSKKWQVIMFLVACFSPCIIALIVPPAAIGLTAFFMVSSPTEEASSTTPGGGSGSIIKDGYTFPIPIPYAYNYSDTWGAPRSGGRTHEGTDIFGDKHTPLVAVTDGTIGRMTVSGLGGISIRVLGKDGKKYYYTHLNNDNIGTDDGSAPLSLSFAPGITEGMEVTAGTVIGYLGDSGNAEGTPPHLHFGVYNPLQNPYPLLACWDPIKDDCP